MDAAGVGSCVDLRSMLIEAEKRDEQLGRDLRESQEEKEQILASGEVHLQELRLELQQLKEKIDQIEEGNVRKAKAVCAEVDGLLTQMAGLEKRKKTLLEEA